MHMDYLLPLIKVTPNIYVASLSPDASFLVDASLIVTYISSKIQLVSVLGLWLEGEERDLHHDRLA